MSRANEPVPMPSIDEEPSSAAGTPGAQTPPAEMATIVTAATGSTIGGGDGSASSSSSSTTAGDAPTAAPHTASGHPKPAHHVHYAQGLGLDTTNLGVNHSNNNGGGGGGGGGVMMPPRHSGEGPTTTAAGLLRTDTLGFGGSSPVLRRRATTFRTVEDFEAFEARPGWQPGAEPGVDPNKPDGGHASMPVLRAQCDITVVDFSQERMVTHRLDNESLRDFLAKPQAKWVKCRWINVNGLSWDVIKMLGQHKRLHKLAIEDILNTRNRTKTDWYANHAFIVLTLQKLVHIIDPDEAELQESDVFSVLSGRSAHTVKGVRGFFRRQLARLFGRGKTASRPPSSSREAEKGNIVDHANGHGAASSGSSTGVQQHGGLHHPGPMHHAGAEAVRTQPTGFSDVPSVHMLRTLHRYHASPNHARTEYMEKHSALSGRNLAVSAEQVSIFITNDNTIISFFELSAEDVERPILTRLHTAGTILRQSCDASMVGQAIIDAIIDLAIPVTALYGDVIGDLELDVLTKPSINHTKSLYIIICEINKMLSFVKPVINLVNALRDHKTDMTQENANAELQNPAKGVIITPMTHTYLGDVLDHCVLISESLEQVRASADGMIGLIFNTVSSYQNQSMKQLSLITVIFLPLTFLTGYFGQNFRDFTELDYGTSYFWKVGAPFAFVVFCLVMWGDIAGWSVSFLQRRSILRIRKHNKKMRTHKKD